MIAAEVDEAFPLRDYVDQTYEAPNADSQKFEICLYWNPDGMR
jgi:hypothetical protein